MRTENAGGRWPGDRKEHRRRALAGLLILGSWLAAASGGRAECREVTVEAETNAEAGIELSLGEWAAAVVSGDTAALAALVTADAEFWTHGAAPLRGREELARAFERLFSSFKLGQEFRCEELVVSGSWAFLRGLEVNRLTPRAGGETSERNQRAFSLLRRESDGRWRFARGMTNLGPPEESGR